MGTPQTKRMRPWPCLSGHSSRLQISLVLRKRKPAAAFSVGGDARPFCAKTMVFRAVAPTTFSECCRPFYAFLLN